MPRDPEKLKAAKHRYYEKYKAKILAYLKHYRETHRDELRTKNRAARRQNIMTARQRERAYDAAHREERRAYLRAYQEQHREELNAKQRAAWKQHREKFLARDKGYKVSNPMAKARGFQEPASQRGVLHHSARDHEAGLQSNHKLHSPILEDHKHTLSGRQRPMVLGTALASCMTKSLLRCDGIPHNNQQNSVKEQHRLLS